MLHEVLLALSGHPSPLFGQHDSPGNTGNGVNQADDLSGLLSPSENALLRSIGRLAELHRKLRQHAQWIATHHLSAICRATATAIQQKHLARFQKKILEVESKILTKDSTVVGAYDIVPLASVVEAFDDSHRLMAWLWGIACFMQPESPSKGDRGCTGTALINKLRDESNTGFPEIEEAATELSRIAETAWLRQLSSWLVYGKLPAHGGKDFFVRQDAGGITTFAKEKHLQPAFVTPATASSIMFVGKSLHQARQQGGQDQPANLPHRAKIADAQLASTHLKYLSDLALPIVPAQLTRAVSAIRLSLSQNVLQHLLPMDEIQRLLSCFRRYFLLGRGEFALALIEQAEARLEARQHRMGRLLQQDPVKALQGLSIKDAELHQVLAQTWKALAREDEDGDDEVLDFAMKHVILAAGSKASARPSSSDDSVYGATPHVTPVAFNDLLFPSVTAMDMDLQPPADLFISPKEVETYAVINSYLLAIRRSQVRLSEMWRRTAARRDHPSPTGRGGLRLTSSPEARARITKRTKDTRKIWATCSATIFLVSETAAYFEGEIVRESCDHFEAWVRKPTSNDESDVSSASLKSSQGIDVAQRDPETLSAAHRSFLASLTYAILLTDVPYTRELRSLLGNIDALVAFFNRLLDVQQKFDLELASDSESTYTAEEESRISLELDRARKKVDSDLRSVVNRLRQLDHERIGSGRYFDLGVAESGGFEPWKGGGVDRLLMKLEFGRMRDEDLDIV